MDETQTGTMRENVTLLHALRREKATIDEQIALWRTAWEEEMQYTFANKTNVEAKIAEVDAEIRAERLGLYDGEDKSKMLGVAVREETRLNYDEGDALDWAMEHQMAVKLDKGAFEKLAKLMDISFVKVEKILAATIAADLSEFVSTEVPESPRKSQ